MAVLAPNPDRLRLLLDGLAPARPTRIVDVAANPVIPPPYRALLAAGACEVWGFEPQPEALAALQAAKGPNETYLPHAVGAGGPAVLRMTRVGGFASLLEPAQGTFRALGHFTRGGRVDREVQVETVRLDDVAEVPAFDLLKIDVQGGEVAVFSGAARHLSTAVAVMTEVAAVPLYVDQPLLDAQMAVLRGHGFHLHRFAFFKTLKFRDAATARLPDRQFRSQLCDGDAIFVRGLLDREGMETEALKHLAVLADAVFGSHDLAAVAVAELARRGAVAADLADRYVDHLVPPVPSDRPMAEERTA